MNKLLLPLLGAAACVMQGCAVKPSPDAVAVYTFQPPAASTPEDSKRLIEKFIGARDLGDLYRADDRKVYYVSKQDVTETFEFDPATGNLTFNKSRQKYSGDFVPQLPGRDQSVSLAEEFLRKNDLAPKDWKQLKVVHLGGLRSTSVVDGKHAGPVVDKLVTVNFGRVVDGIPVIGPGSKIVVHIGDKGEVVGAIHRWRELGKGTQKRSVRPEETVSAKEAEEMARRQILSEYGEGTNYRILGSGKRYFDNNGKVLQPVYAFEVEIAPKDPKVQPFHYLCVIPMLRESPEPLNLTAIDPAAKRLIGTSRRGQNPQTTERLPSD